jgi:hypothetical protein
MKANQILSSIKSFGDDDLDMEIELTRFRSTTIPTTLRQTMDVRAGIRR